MPTANPVLSGSVRVNVRTAVNNAQIRRDTRNGREVIVVPSKTLPDDVKMNGITYRRNEKMKSIHTLERTWAPAGHPKINGKYVSATLPEASVIFNFGAWNENVRDINGIVHVDKVIDVEAAKSSEKGLRVLEAINKGDPIHTSTGIFMNVVDGEARDMYFDHDAILLDEEGAATPEQGVGMLVNSSSEELELMVINSVCVMSEFEKVADEIGHKSNQEKLTILNRILSALKLGKDKTPGESLKANGNSEVIDMPTLEERFEALEKSVETLTANANKAAESTTKAMADAIAPVMKAIEALTANAAKAEEAERAELTAKVVANNLLTEETAKTLSVNALRELAGKVKGDAAPITQGVFMPNNSGYKSLSDELPGGAE
jgi:hypothetical protein